MISRPLRFPPDFAFGVATAAYQLEGHIENDWSDWERAGRTSLLQLIAEKLEIATPVRVIK